MFVSDKKTCQNRVYLSVLARFLKGDGGGFGLVFYMVSIIVVSKNFSKISEKTKKLNYHVPCILINCCIPLNLGSKLACIALNMLVW